MIRSPRKYAFAAMVLTSVLLAPVGHAAGSNSKLVSKQAVLTEFATCVLKQSPDRVREFLSTPVGSADEKALAQALLTKKSQCTKGRAVLSMQTGQARGALAEAVMKSDPAIAGQVAQLVPETAPRPTETAGRPFVMAFARCLTSTSPSIARQLIATEHGTPEETTAMTAFGPALQDCMPIGLVYRINVTDVRNHVATALYDRAIASSGGGDTNA